MSMYFHRYLQVAHIHLPPSPPITNHLPRILLSGHHNLASCPLRSTFPPTVTPFQLSHHLIFFVQDRFLAQASFFHQQYLRLIFFQWKNLERQPVTYKTFRMYRVLGEIPLMLLI